MTIAPVSPNRVPDLQTLSPAKPPVYPNAPIALTPKYLPSPTVEDFLLSFASGPQEELRMLILQSPRGEGKGLRPDDLILTPTGWTKVKDLKLGDAVVAGDGTATTVLGIYPQPEQPLWRLRFSDLTSLVTTDDHLWAVETKWDRDGHHDKNYQSRAKANEMLLRPPRYIRQPRVGLKVTTTAVIRERLASGAWRSGGRWSIPLCGPVQFPARPIPLDPYLLGLLLGNGCFTKTSSVMLSTGDSATVMLACHALPPGHTIKPAASYDYRIVGPRPRRPGTNEVLQALRALGLMGHLASSKFIPDCYLWNTTDVRHAVLQGLLDTDGTVLAHSNSVSYSTTSERLAEGVEFLVRSLGGVTRRRMRHTHYTYRGERRSGQPSYHISVRLPNRIAPFRLERKAELVRAKGRRNQARRFIVSYEPAGEGPSICLKVAHASALYITHDFIVTHNTSAGIHACDQLAERKLASYLDMGCQRVRRIHQDVWTLSAEDLKIFLDAMVAGDGHSRALRPRQRERERQVNTASVGLAGDLQAIAMMAGLYARVFVRPPSSRLIRDRNGRSHCLTVPNGTLYIRRHGIAHWNGNTPSCVFSQTLQNGNINIFGSRMGEGKAMGTFVAEDVLTPGAGP